MSWPTSIAEEKARGLSDELFECSFHRWYDKFEKVTIRGIATRIPPGALEYLRENIIVLPKECDPKYEPGEEPDNNGDDDDALVQPEFPTFSAVLAKRIAKLNNSVFIKTNWHCAQDAYWITVGQTLKVRDITDAYQLLKASTAIKSDLANHGLPQSRHAQSPYEFFVVLKEWQEIHSGTEFRCFVRNQCLIAISPRELPDFNWGGARQRNEIVSDIVSFFKEQIKYLFPLQSYVFDVVRASKDHVQLVDFSPFNEKLTESLAFNWDQLNDEKFRAYEDDDPEFRYFPKNGFGVEPTRRIDHGIPADIDELLRGSGSTDIVPHWLDLNYLENLGN